MTVIDIATGREAREMRMGANTIIRYPATWSDTRIGNYVNSLVRAARESVAASDPETDFHKNAQAFLDEVIPIIAVIDPDNETPEAKAEIEASLALKRRKAN